VVVQEAAPSRGRGFGSPRQVSARAVQRSILSLECNSG
jgi:hypothetical protein